MTNKTPRPDPNYSPYDPDCATCRGRGDYFLPPTIGVHTPLFSPPPTGRLVPCGQCDPGGDTARGLARLRFKWRLRSVDKKGTTS